MDGVARIAFPVPNIVDDASYAIECAAVGEVDLVGLDRQIRDARARIAELEAAFWPRVPQHRQTSCPPPPLASARMADTELDVRERAPALAAEPSQPTQRVDRVTVIKPAPRWPHLDLRELWHYRELLARLAWRDIAVRYKQTSIGVAWAILSRS